MNLKRKAPTHTKMDGVYLPLVDSAGVALTHYPWSQRSVEIWAADRKRQGRTRYDLVMYLDAHGWCTTCKGRGQVTETPRPVFGESIKVYYRPCPAKCKQGRIRPFTAPWTDPETGDVVQPAYYYTTTAPPPKVEDDTPEIPPDDD